MRDYIQSRAAAFRERTRNDAQRQAQHLYRRTARWMGKPLAHAVNLVCLDGVVSFVYAGHIYYVTELEDWLTAKLVSVCDQATYTPFAHTMRFYDPDALCAWLAEGGWEKRK